MATPNYLLGVYQRHISGSVLVILLLSTFALITIATYAVFYVGKNTENNLTSTLNAEAHNKAIDVTLWLNRVKDDVNTYTNREQLYIYCSEAMLHVQQTDRGEIPIWATPGDDSLTEIENIRNVLENDLAALALEQNFNDVTVWGANMEPLLHIFPDAPPTINPEQDTLLRSTLNTGRAHFSPVYIGAQGLMMDLASPIFTKTKSEPVAVIFVNIPVKTKLAELFPTVENESMISHRLLQWTKSTSNLLQYIDIYRNDIFAMADWEAPFGAALPFKERNIPGEQTVYSLGIPVKGYDLLVAYETSTLIVKDSYSGFRYTIITIVVLSLIALAVTPLLSWVFFLENDGKALEDKMTNLADEISTKEELLNNINATLVDGVVLTNRLGNIQYANNSFAQLVNYESEALVGCKMGAILKPEVAERLQKQINTVVRTEAPHTFEVPISISGKTKYFQALCVPYFGQNQRVSGVVSVYRDVTDTFLERKTEQKRIEQLIAVLMRAVELVNPYLCGHSLALGTLATELAKKLKCTPEEQKTLHIAASLSQIGMIGLPGELLNKKEKLTDNEREILETHVERASKVLEFFDFGLPVQETIAQMNEKIDGSGYPRKLKGDEISFPARILNLANVFCALLRPRIYRDSKTLGEVLAILDNDKALYDPLVLSALNAYAASDKGKNFVKALQSEGKNFIESYSKTIGLRLK